MAVDWDDAEMWLEGAVQSQWSVSAMRRQRVETLGLVEQMPVDDETMVVAGGTDEDFDTALNVPPQEHLAATTAQVMPHNTESLEAGEGASKNDEFADDVAPVEESLPPVVHSTI